MLYLRNFANGTLRLYQEVFRKTKIKAISERSEGAFIAFLIYAGGIIAIVVAIFAVWQGMKAIIRLAASMERVAESMEKIEGIIGRNQSQL
ncbi:MAG TPA: hypothetical protein VFY40_15235 [Blastocatellia bacterium]|nr:hypothetical protein [Blastocatellia bacterium]